MPQPRELAILAAARQGSPPQVLSPEPTHKTASQRTATSHDGDILGANAVISSDSRWVQRTMFEITPQDIAQLDDKQLRTLVGMLCEAELRSCGYSTAAVTWGGDQSAKDGGVDVRVSLSDDKPIDGFIPRRSTGFQVKKQDMPPHAIAAEMCPNGVLRPAIGELAQNRGAYIIVSSQGSTTDSALTNRRNAMAEAARGLANQLALDFYDRTRLASWVHHHAGLIVWVRRTIGRAIPGWEPFGAWAYPAGGTEAEYLLEKGVRLRSRPAKNDVDLSAEAGLKRIRDILRNPGSVVRLVGLSGVGKTRFVQALFDGRIGDGALDPTLAVYTNMNNDPDPQPFGLASDLIANSTRAILIVDNCASDLHARLSQLVKTAGSPLSALTVEYDIRDDQPEGTEVFEVQVASIELIEKLLQKRFAKLSQVDARTAASFSGGNARIAIALADTVNRGGTLASLNDTELFERLFSQRQQQDRSLLAMAQACALVYSFNGEDLSDGADGELAKIARLIGATADQAHRDVAELLRRDLAQRRGRWRAILPHAVANRLAATALQDIPFARIQECLINGAPERLTTSLSRRIGYLDTSAEAAAIVRDWLDPRGWIGTHIWNLNEFGKAMFQNSLPANPEAGLQALTVNLPTHDTNTPITTGEYVPRVLRSMAWDAALFDRCASLLQVLAIYGEGKIAKDATEMHKSLFHLYLSGTHATAKQRSAVVKSLLNSTNPHERGLGLAALDAMLQSMHFSSDYDFQFGAHSRDYGYQPRTYGELKDWYKTALAVAEEIALSSAAVASAAKVTISANFRGMWTCVGLHDELEGISTKCAAQGFWRDGWLAVKQTRTFDEKDKTSANYARLSRLEKMLRPRDLVQNVRGRVLASKGAFYDVDEVDTNNPNNFRVAMEQKNEQAVALGREVANDEAALHELMPEIVGGQGNLWYFGMGLAGGAKNPKELWQEMVRQFAQTPLENRDARVFCGMLLELNTKKSELPDQLLDEALATEPLAAYFPSLQASIAIDPRGMARLSRSLELGKVPIHAYTNIHLGRAINAVPGADIARYILALAKAPDGESVAILALSMQFFVDRQDKRPYASEIVVAGRELLQKMKFDRGNVREDYHLQEVVEVCLGGEGGYAVAKTICLNLTAAIAEHKTYGFHHNQLVAALFKIQPRATLDAFLTGDEKAISAGQQVIEQAGHLRPNPMDELSEATLFEWCGSDPSVRFPLAASVVEAFTVSNDHNPVEWAPIASNLVHSAPDQIAVMREFVARFRPMTWSGSRSTILDANANLLDQFDTQGNTALAAYIAAEKKMLQREARAQLEWETKVDKDRDERFE